MIVAGVEEGMAETARTAAVKAGASLLVSVAAAQKVGAGTTAAAVTRAQVEGS